MFRQLFQQAVAEFTEKDANDHVQFSHDRLTLPFPEHPFEEERYDDDVNGQEGEIAEKAG